MEPWRWKRWKISPSSARTDFYTCARPGRSKGSKGKVPDRLLRDSVLGLPAAGNVVVVSLLGHKPDGTSEFSFYSFFGRRQSFQQWLDREYPEKAIKVVEHPTCDFRPVPNETLAAVASDILKLLSEGRTVVLVDSGGIQRTGQVCRHLGASEDSSQAR